MICRVGDGRFFPYKAHQRKYGGRRPVWIYSREEALVFLMAHELRHIWQGGRGARRRGMAWGARGRFPEVDADAWALKMLRAWRRSRPRVAAARPLAELVGRSR